MDPQLATQIGIGGLTLWILYDYLKRTDKRIDERDKSFAKFVDEHNDTMGALVRTSTSAIQETGEAVSLRLKRREMLRERLIRKMTDW